MSGAVHTYARDCTENTSPTAYTCSSDAMDGNVSLPFTFRLTQTPPADDPQMLLPRRGLQPKLRHCCLRTWKQPRLPFSCRCNIGRQHVRYQLIYSEVLYKLANSRVLAPGRFVGSDNVTLRFILTICPISWKGWICLMEGFSRWTSLCCRSSRK